MTYKYIRRLWSNSSPYADKDSDSGDGKSENDDQIDSHLDDNKHDSINQEINADPNIINNSSESKYEIQGNSLENANL